MSNVLTISTTSMDGTLSTFNREYFDFNLNQAKRLLSYKMYPQVMFKLKSLQPTRMCVIACDLLLLMAKKVYKAK